MEVTSGESAYPDSDARVEFFELVLSTESIEDFLAELVTTAAATVDDNLSAAITTRRDRRPITVAASDAFANDLDEVQYANGFGPCLRAMDTGTRVEITNLADELEQWGVYGSHALAHGLAACISTPMVCGGRVWGALNLYSPLPELFTADDRVRADTIATQAATAYAIADRIAQQNERAGNLNAALSSRAVIDQAIGIIMGAQHCGADAAFTVLRSASQHRNLKLRDIAARIVADTVRTVSPPPAVP
ncbi:MAG: GAF and ANTAR domain-containing protein [Mycobacteriales bacterium]